MWRVVSAEISQDFEPRTFHVERYQVHLTKDIWDAGRRAGAGDIRKNALRFLKKFGGQ
jgi:hypothetical protein